MNLKTFYILLITSTVAFAQVKKIRLLSADISTANEKKYPDATLLIGNVKIFHDGTTLECKRGMLYRKKNIFKAIGDVVIEQGDSIIQYSDFSEYNANIKLAKSWGNVELHNKNTKLSSDSLYFDRKKNIVYYPSYGKIKDNNNTLTSKSGTYFINRDKFLAKGDVKMTNDKNDITSEKLDYNTKKDFVYFLGPTTIVNKKDSTKLHTEKGYHDNKKEISFFNKKTKLFSKNRTLIADSLYYNKPNKYASASNNVIIIDSLNKTTVKGNYAELFEKKDSLIITKKPIAIIEQDKDSLFIHGDTILVTSKNKNKHIRTFHKVRIYKSDIQGVCDSVDYNQSTRFTKMFKKPILWSYNNQISGDTIHFLNNSKTKKIDSLFIYNNAFVTQKDTLSKNNFNQIKGRDMYGSFLNNKLKNLIVKGNAESVYYNRNEKTSNLETITTEIASDIEFTFIDGQIEETKYLKKSEGKTYPPSKFPKNKSKLNGFFWEEDQRPKNKDDIFRTKKNKTLKKTKVDQRFFKTPRTNNSSPTSN